MAETPPRKQVSPGRWLAPGGGYRDRPTAAVDPLEAISADEQEQVTRAARAARQRELRGRWGAAAATITSTVDDFYGAGLDRPVRDDLRQILRATRRVSRRLDIQ